MKRMIVCQKCFRVIKGIPVVDPERREIFFGLALEKYKCDHGGEIIEKKEPCFAVSFWTLNRIPYYHWEEEYLFVPEDPKRYYKSLAEMEGA